MRLCGSRKESARTGRESACLFYCALVWSEGSGSGRRTGVATMTTAEQGSDGSKEQTAGRSAGARTG